MASSGSSGRATNRPRIDRDILHASMDDVGASRFKSESEREEARMHARLEAFHASAIRLRRTPVPVRPSHGT